MLSLMTATALAKEENQHFSNDNWEGTLSNLDWGQIALSVDGPSLDWDHPYWKWWIFKIPSVYLGVTLKIGCSGDFDVTIKDANLKDTVNVDTKISSDASEIFLSGKQMYRHKMTSDNLLDYLPKLPLLSGSIEGDFVAAATAPVKASGHFNNVVKLTLSTRDGAEKKEDRTFNLTSVEPTEPNKDVVFFIGSEFNETVSVLSVNLKVVTLGPLLSTNINMMAGANTAARKDKDLVDIETVLTSSDPSFHACVVKKDPGCVKGKENDIAAEIVTLRINIGGHIFGKDRSIFDHTWTLSKDYRLIHGNRQFIKSLTFNEPFK
ncbi:MAG: hypothetical protein J6B53_12370, partial [Clostridia bacterium]|nr:hypothetical protein [Clostridia bacterium]